MWGKWRTFPIICEMSLCFALSLQMFSQFVYCLANCDRDLGENGIPLPLKLKNEGHILWVEVEIGLAQDLGAL